MKNRLRMDDLLWVLIMTMQTGFLGLIVFQQAMPDGYAWLGWTLFLISAAVLIYTIRWAFRKKTAEEIAEDLKLRVQPSASKIEAARKTMFWCMTFATAWMALKLSDDEYQAHLLTHGAVLLAIYFGSLWLIRKGKLDWFIR